MKRWKPFLILLLATLSYAGPSGSTAEEGPPIDIQVYFSKEDPTWKETRQAIQKVANGFPRLQIEMVSIDEPPGYDRLAKAEKDLNIKPTGEITLIMGPYHLNSQGKRRDIETHFEALIKRILKPEIIKGRIESEVRKFASEAFGPEAAVMESVKSGQGEFLYYEVKEKEQTKGWIVDAFRHIACPVCNDVQFMAAIHAKDRSLIDIRPVRPLERWGKELSKKETTGFLLQFKGKTLLKTDTKVDTISGATKTSLAYRQAVDQILQGAQKLNPSSRGPSPNPTERSK